MALEGNHGLGECPAHEKGAFVAQPLHRTLASVLSAEPDASAVKSYATLCQRAASLYIRKKIRAGNMCPYFLGLSADDLAMDCVAALFERDQCGRFTQLCVYYSRIGWEHLGEDELLSFTRRLVFSKVNQEFSRLCKENDPALEKLMRSIRNAARKTGAFSIRRRKEGVWLVTPGGSAAQTGKRVMPPEFLETRLTPHLHEDISVREVVRAASLILRGQREYLRGYPLTGLALVIRSAFTRIGGMPDTVPEEESLVLRSGELKGILASSVAAVRFHLHEKYVESRKMSRQTYNAHFHAVMDILAAEYLGEDGGGRTFFGHLSRELPGLTRQSYRYTYRSRLEYFVKRARDQFLRSMRKEI